MPARETYAPGTWPVHLPACISVLPEGEIFRRVLIFGYLYLLATMPTCSQIFDGVARKLPIIWEATNIVINITIYSVCQAFLNQLLGHHLHLWNVIGCPGIDMRR